MREGFVGLCRRELSAFSCLISTFCGRFDFFTELLEPSTSDLGARAVFSDFVLCSESALSSVAELRLQYPESLMGSRGLSAGLGSGCSDWEDEAEADEAPDEGGGEDEKEGCDSGRVSRALPRRSEE